MRTLARLTVIETRLMLREISPPLFTVLLPIALLVVFGAAASTRKPDPALGGHRGIDTIIPSMSVMVAMAMVAFFMLPVVLATYREKGVLRRFATTPVKPSALLGAQLVMNGGVVLVATLLTLVVGVVALDMRLPNLLLVLPTFVLGVLGLFPIGLLVAAVASSAKAATGYALGAWFPSAFFAGLYVPVEYLPPVLRRIGDLTPLGAFRQAIQAAWVGDVPRPLHLTVLAVSFLAATYLAVRLFRSA
ncbi:ABC transporter permease [Dactylosporangium roseum]|uniref:ABC transporter permease n=1 Tax=Dactylosporangium roseum TaxID=47989 RepID=A0ABY5YZC0_9ACTN|nr:ABC transporter permease [Dactylosporangium roseum]UWZ35106.1 ABC transporter permease [Dactylosporangium roseum]